MLKINHLRPSMRMQLSNKLKEVSQMDVKYNIITIQFESQDLMWQQDGMLNALEETPDKI